MHQTKKRKEMPTKIKEKRRKAGKKSCQDNEHHSDMFGKGLG